MKESLVFIINPISGQGNKDRIQQLIKDQLDVSRYDYSVVFTTHAGHAKTLAEEAVNKHIGVVVAVGGDGTINEIVHALAGSEVKLGILPLGSGNGLGRHVGIPMKTSLAIQTINRGKCIPIDTCVVNEHTFVNIAGIGFDAFVSKVFNEENQRGYLSYVKSVIQHFRRYKPQTYKFKTNGESQEARFLTIAFANSQQYGNNAYVAPLASIKDGYMDIVFIRPFSVLYWPAIIYKTLLKKLHTSRFIETVRTKKFNVTADSSFPIHLDGDYFGEWSQVNVEIKPKSLKLIVGKEEI